MRHGVDELHPVCVSFLSESAVKVVVDERDARDQQWCCSLTAYLANVRFSSRGAIHIAAETLQRHVEGLRMQCGGDSNDAFVGALATTLAQRIIGCSLEERGGGERDATRAGLLASLSSHVGMIEMVSQSIVPRVPLSTVVEGVTYFSLSNHLEWRDVNSMQRFLELPFSVSGSGMGFSEQQVGYQLAAVTASRVFPWIQKRLLAELGQGSVGGGELGLLVAHRLLRSAVDVLKFAHSATPRSFVATGVSFVLEAPPSCPSAAVSPDQTYIPLPLLGPLLFADSTDPPDLVVSHVTLIRTCDECDDDATAQEEVRSWLGASDGVRGGDAGDMLLILCETAVSQRHLRAVQSISTAEYGEKLLIFAGVGHAALRRAALLLRQLPIANGSTTAAHHRRAFTADPSIKLQLRARAVGVEEAFWFHTSRRNVKSWVATLMPLARCPSQGSPGPDEGATGAPPFTTAVITGSAEGSSSVVEHYFWRGISRLLNVVVSPEGGCATVGAGFQVAIAVCAAKRLEVAAQRDLQRCSGQHESFLSVCALRSAALLHESLIHVLEMQLVQNRGLSHACASQAVSLSILAVTEHHAPSARVDAIIETSRRASAPAKHASRQDALLYALRHKNFAPLRAAPRSPLTRHEFVTCFVAQPPLHNMQAEHSDAETVLLGDVREWVNPVAFTIQMRTVVAVVSALSCQLIAFAPESGVVIV